MKAYKGFNRNEDGTLSCRGFVYELGKTYKHEGIIELCESGFHACHELWQTWRFYPNNGQTAYYEVECGGDVTESKDSDGKFVCSEVTLVKEIDMTEVARFDNTWPFSEGFATVRVNRKYNFVNTGGKLLSELWFEYADDFNGGFAPVKLDGKWNYINTEGKLLSELWFEYVDDFNGGFAKFRLNGKYNFINTEGELLSEQWFDDALSFADSSAQVKLGGKWMKINTKGEII